MTRPSEPLPTYASLRNDAVSVNSTLVGEMSGLLFQLIVAKRKWLARASWVPPSAARRMPQRTVRRTGLVIEILSPGNGSCPKSGYSFQNI